MRVPLVLGLVAGLTALVVLPGCGDLPRSRVHGKVTYLGTPVSGGTVIFLTRDNMTHVADLQPDGTYAVTGIPRGPVRVSIQQPPPRPATKSEVAPRGGPKLDPEGKGSGAAAAAAEPRAAGVRVPPVYADPGQSGLAFELKDPDQEYSVDLK